MKYLDFDMTIRLPYFNSSRAPASAKEDALDDWSEINDAIWVCSEPLVKLWRTAATCTVIKVFFFNTKTVWFCFVHVLFYTVQFCSPLTAY